MPHKRRNSFGRVSTYDSNMALLFLFAAIAFLVQIDASCDYESHVNGCSVPLGMPFPFKPLFTPVCNRHDVCYICVCIHFLSICFSVQIQFIPILGMIVLSFLHLFFDLRRFFVQKKIIFLATRLALWHARLTLLFSFFVPPLPSNLHSLRLLLTLSLPSFVCSASYLYRSTKRSTNSSTVLFLSLPLFPCRHDNHIIIASIP